MAYSGQPGISVGVGYDQELIWAHGFGVMNLESGTPTTPDTIYRCASITKLFTATSIMQLRDAGKLQLDDPITKHLPWFSVQSEYDDAPAITIRHLITHTSGLPREAAFPYWIDTNFPTIDQVRDALPGQSTVLPTEEKWKYSNLALSLAGEIVAAVSGQPYTDYVREHVLEPLGMESSYIDPVPADHERLATGYGRRLPDGTRQISPYTDCRAITPAANLASTVNDLARFAMLQLRDGPASGSQILRGSTLKEMKRIHWLQEDWQAGWGLGFYVWRYNGKTYAGHGGSLQGYRTDVQVCPADKTFAVVLTNADDGEPLSVMAKIIDWVFPAITAAVAPEPETPDTSGWQRYLGKYRNTWGDCQIIIHEGQLLAITPSLPDPMAARITLIPVSEHTFRMDSKNGFGTHNELMTFELDESSAVKVVKSGNTYLFPIEEW